MVNQNKAEIVAELKNVTQEIVVVDDIRWRAERFHLEMIDVDLEMIGKTVFLIISILGRNKDKLEGYGRITQKRANTKVGHYFWDFTVAKPVDIELPGFFYL